MLLSLGGGAKVGGLALPMGVDAGSAGIFSIEEKPPSKSSTIFAT